MIRNKRNRLIALIARIDQLIAESRTIAREVVDVGLTANATASAKRTAFSVRKHWAAAIRRRL
jgi:hypothetical protein